MTDRTKKTWSTLGAIVACIVGILAILQVVTPLMALTDRVGKLEASDTAKSSDIVLVRTEIAGISGKMDILIRGQSRQDAMLSEIYREKMR